MKKYYLSILQKGGNEVTSNSSTSEDTLEIEPNLTNITIPREQLNNTLAMLTYCQHNYDMCQKKYILDKYDECNKICNKISNLINYK